MAELSRENLGQNQESEQEKLSAEIIKILEDFVTNGKYRLEINEEENNRKKNENFLSAINLIKSCASLFLIGILFLFLMYLMYEFNISTTFINLFARIAKFILFCMLGLTLWKIYKQVEKLTTTTTKKAIYRAVSYDICSYYQVIKELGIKFKVKDLNKEIIRFKAIINQIKDNKGLLSKLIPAFAILIVIWGIAIFGMPNYNQVTNQLFTAILSISGLIAIANIVLNFFLELFSHDLAIYEQCILILQEAQNISKEVEASNKKPSIDQNIKDKNLFKYLKRIK